MIILSQIDDILSGSKIHLSDILPHEWGEQNMKVKKGNFQGPLSYNRTPYSRKIVDCMSPYNPFIDIILMGGSQWGKTVSIIEVAIAYLIANHPSEMAYLTGHTDLSEEAMEKLDSALDNSGVGKLIRKFSLRKNNRRTGDTTKYKEFAGGSLVSGSATNHKLLRQRSWKYVFPDDIEAAKSASKESGDTVSLIKARTDSFGNKAKRFWCSTPESLDGSIINGLFLTGDQQYYNIPCQCCGKMIPLHWEIDIEGTSGKEKGGIHWKLDPTNRLIPESVGYVCQICGGWFNEKNKYEFNMAGMWVPTAIAENNTTTSFHLSRLYAQPGMTGWVDNVAQYLKACPPGQTRKESLYKTFVNLVLGVPHKAESISPSANSIQKNIRPYKIGTLPEKLSIADGNGRIILLTCAADMNGKVDDARLDYELVAWTEAGASYSILHGSIGTFVPRENSKKEVADRRRYTYEFGKPYNVWDEFTKIIQAQYLTDTGRVMKVAQTGLDCGFFSNSHAYPYIDKMNPMPKVYVVGLKGRKADTYVKRSMDLRPVKPSQERPNLYSVTVGNIKDELAEYMQAKWNENDPSQPPGFMNFPEPENGLYTFGGYFEHFESEHCVMAANKDGTEAAYRWEKKSGNVMNHFWDVRVYNMAMREIIIEFYRKEYKLPKITWKEVATAITGGK